MLKRKNEENTKEKEKKQKTSKENIEIESEELQNYEYDEVYEGIKMLRMKLYHHLITIPPIIIKKMLSKTIINDELDKSLFELEKNEKIKEFKITTNNNTDETFILLIEDYKEYINEVFAKNKVKLKPKELEELKEKFIKLISTMKNQFLITEKRFYEEGFSEDDVW
jgi:hypothetical protein